MKDLLSHLSQVESLLNTFSFEKLATNDAHQLKKSYLAFRTEVEEMVYGKVSIPNTDPQEPNGNRTDFLQSTSKSSEKGREAMLIANVSHEIRTPLNGIIGFTDLLKEDTLSEIQLERINAIQNASYTLLDIINELLEFSKLSAGLEPFESVHFSFYGLIRDIVFLCNTLITSKQVNLEVDMDPAIPEVIVGDPAKLSQVLLNLLGNAIKFVDKGEIALKILLKKESEGLLFLEFIVSDNGIGIDADQLPFIFDSYKQAAPDTSKIYGGTGLGLSIVKQIIINLGGDITVSSNLGKGTTFKFMLPYAIGEKARLPKNDRDKNHLREGAKLIKGMSILVFEDNLLNQRLIEQRLKKWGCRTYITDNCQYGLNILYNEAIDLVLMDLRMPGMSGFEVTECIRKSDSKTVSQVPIIALTADFTIQDKQKSELNGINDYILKPYSPDELLLKLVKNKNSTAEIDTSETISIRSLSESSDDDKCFDLEAVFEDCVGQMELLEELVHLYKQNAIEFIGAAKVHLKAKDYNALEFVLHKIKSGLAMMRTDELHAIVVLMQGHCKGDQDLAQLEILYSRFLDEYPRIEEQIDKAVSHLKKKQ